MFLHAHVIRRERDETSTHSRFVASFPMRAKVRYEVLGKTINAPYLFAVSQCPTGCASADDRHLALGLSLKFGGLPRAALTFMGIRGIYYQRAYTFRQPVKCRIKTNPVRALTVRSIRSGDGPHCERSCDERG